MPLSEYFIEILLCLCLLRKGQSMEASACSKIRRALTRQQNGVSKRFPARPICDNDTVHQAHARPQDRAVPIAEQHACSDAPALLYTWPIHLRRLCDNQDTQGPPLRRWSLLQSL